MDGNRGRQTAAAGAAVVVIGGGALAHSTGALRNAWDDIFRAGRQGDEVVPPPRGDPPPVLTPAENLVRQGEEDDVAYEVICFAYQNFYDASIGEFVPPSEDEFVEAVAQTLAAPGSQLSYRLKAEALYEELTDPDADLASVAQELAC